MAVILTVYIDHV